MGQSSRWSHQIAIYPANHQLHEFYAGFAVLSLMRTVTVLSNHESPPSIFQSYCLILHVKENKPLTCLPTSPLTLENAQVRILRTIILEVKVMKRLKTLLAALFVATISVSAALAQQAMYVEPGRYEIEIASTGKVLDLRKEDMRTVQQYYRGDVRNQEWDIISAGGNSYYIRSAENGGYMGIQNSSQGARVTVDNSARGDTWKFIRLNSGNVMIVHRSGMALDLTNGATNNGVPLQVWSQARNANQQFKLVPVTVGAVNNPNNPNASEYNEGYQAGISDRRMNLNNNYRRYRHLYDRYTENEFQRGYNAGYTSGRNNEPWSQMNANERRNYDEAYRLGQQDARVGYNANYRRYNGRYNNRVESAFRQGYEAGYNSLRNDSGWFDLSRLNQYERRVYDNGYNYGRQDARRGYAQDYRRYNRQFTSQMEFFFRRGYEAGFNSIRHR